MGIFNKKQTIYLDYASTTPIDLGVLSRMNQVYREQYWNPGGLHGFARSAEHAISDYRSRMRDLLHAPNHNVVFTRGGTESCNLAFHSAWQRWRVQNPDVVPTVITSPIEHASVRNLLQHFADKGYIRVIELPVDYNGIVSVSRLREVLSSDVMLVTIQLVNNEIGVVQPIKKLSHIVRDYRRVSGSVFPYIHTDAIQSACTIDIHTQSLGVDYLSLSASKFYGPKSGGVLLVPRNTDSNSILFGGEQEMGWRPGTEDIALIAGTVHAYDIACEQRESEHNRLTSLRESLIAGIVGVCPDIICNTPMDDSSPHILHISIPGYDSEFAVLHFDQAGIAVASGSACSAHSGDVSHVVSALWQVSGRASQIGDYAHIRVSLGRHTTNRDIQRFIQALQKLLDRVYTRN